LGVWQDQARLWLNEKALIYAGTPGIRRRIWDEYVETKGRILVANYSQAEEILQRNRGWHGIVCDEYDRIGLLNRQSQIFETLEGAYSRDLYFVTGTPIRHGPQDMWHPLHLIDPQKYSSYWRFVGHHCIVWKDRFGKTIEPSRPKNVEAYQAEMAPYLLHRTKQQVLTELPPKTRQPVQIEMTGKQALLYNDILHDMYTVTDRGDILVTPNVASQILRLRQCLVTPRLLGVDDPGAALEALKDLAEPELSTKTHAVAVCTPFRQAIPFIEQEMKKLDCKCFEIHGQIKESPHDVATRFQEYKGRKAIIYTIRSGAAFTAHAASTAFFVGYEWSAIDNIQAEDRLHRLGQERPVNIVYLVHEDTVDDLVRHRLDEKTQAAGWILSPNDMYAALGIKSHAN
jgi:SNF2 family DNA or RNA helicase